MQKVLLIGSGAREHVLAATLKRFGAQVYTFGKGRNPGLLEISEEYHTGDLKDFDAMREFALKANVDFAIVGPENPIADGASDMLLEAEIHSVAPLQTVGRLESSKSFTRDLLEKYSIPGNPKFRVFFEDEWMAEFLDELGDDYVVKADGLKGGKGVKVSGDHLASHEEALAFARECLLEGGRIVIEEKLIGQEFSLMSFCDGTTTVEMPAVQDHKRAFDGDKGPNTGGMGSYSDVNHSLPFLTQKDIDDAADITRQVAAALFKETGAQFKGVMYGGFIATADGVRLIEYNARFGDPEVLNVLPLLNTNFVHLCEAIIAGDLKNLPVEFENKATVCKYIVPEGYPTNPKKGQPIWIGDIPDDVQLYYASVNQTPEGLLLSGSRAIGLVGIADTLARAEKMVRNVCDQIRGPIFYRSDIGTESLIQQRINMMKELRG